MRTLVTVVSLVAIIAVAATGAHAAKWYLGAMGGANFADLSGVDEASVRTCFSGGGLVEVDFTEQFGVRVELLYNQKGAEHHENPEFGGEDTTVELTYFDVPVLFVASLNKTETSDFSVFAGPYVGFNTSAEEVPEESPKVDLSDLVEETEFGAVVGVEFEHIRPSVIWFGDMRFTIGATELIKDAASALAEIKNRDFAVLVGVKFPL